MLKISLKISNYKCFGPEEQGFEEIRPINIIIGKNNSGKSALLDLLENLNSPKDLLGHKHNDNNPRISFIDAIKIDEINRFFREDDIINTGNGQQIRAHRLGKKFDDKRAKWEILSNNQANFVEFIEPVDCLEELLTRLSGQLCSVGNVKREKYFPPLTLKRLRAERNISPEQDDRQELRVDENGGGATNVMQSFINMVEWPRDLVEKTILDDLNEIFEPDSKFFRILPQKNKDEKWEIYLEEENKGRVALSHTGSGLKTVLLVLVYIHLVPHIEKKKLDQYMFGFEELENNLHPSLQRRLLLYLKEKAINENCKIFLTTHSNIAIDLFSRDSDAQILHVTHNAKTASVRQVKTYIENKGVLDDLDVRASDLLQSNGVVWVEGPSDKIYFNRWIELWSDGELKEGIDYQCVIYGGRLLAHLSADEPVEVSSRVQILNVNRNMIMLIDSDKKNIKDIINMTKKRICDEVDSLNGYCWITDGREIENYIPVASLNAAFPEVQFPTLKSFKKFDEYLNEHFSKEGKKFSADKVAFARKIVEYIEKEHLIQNKELCDRLEAVCTMIRSWNGKS